MNTCCEDQSINISGEPCLAYNIIMTTIISEHPPFFGKLCDTVPQKAILTTFTNLTGSLIDESVNL